MYVIEYQSPFGTGTNMDRSSLGYSASQEVESVKANTVCLDYPGFVALYGDVAKSRLVKLVPAHLIKSITWKD